MILQSDGQVQSSHAVHQQLWIMPLKLQQSKTRRLVSSTLLSVFL